MKKTALVTGASSGIGRAISRMLVEKGYIVYGIGRTFAGKEKLPDEKLVGGKFYPIEFDLLQHQRLPELLCGLKKQQKELFGEKWGGFSLLVNCAGVGYYGPHEQLSAAQIYEMTTVNLAVPMMLTQLLLRELKENKGMVINISSVTANQSANTHGCAYGATKAGLSGFSRSLCEEVRKYGVRVAVIHPDLTDTGLYRNADFSCSPESDCHILAQEVADAVRYVLEARDGLMIPELTLKPQRNRIERKKG